MAGMDLDPEIAAISQLVDALEPLDQEARGRVLEYAFKRLGIESFSSEASLRRPLSSQAEEPAATSPGAPADIRSLREEKQPNSDTAMAAIVGYYLADLAPESERKAEIATADIERFFKQAGHPLPGAPRNTLPNAAAAGYFDSKGGGQYTLNPVGHNLVTHGLPRASPAPARPKRAKSKGKASKKVRSSSKGSAKGRSSNAKPKAKRPRKK